MKYVPINKIEEYIGEIALVPRLNPQPMLLCDVESECVTFYDIIGEHIREVSMERLCDGERPHIEFMTQHEKPRGMVVNYYINSTNGDITVDRKLKQIEDSDADATANVSVNTHPNECSVIHIRVRNGEIDMLNARFEDVISEAVDTMVLSQLRDGIIDSIGKIGFDGDTVMWVEQDDPFFERDLRDVCIEHGIWDGQ